MLWLACSALVILAGYFVLMPLLQQPMGKLDIELLSETELDRLFDRKAVIYRNLKDLQFEFTMGRLSEVDYRRLEAEYKNEAAAILEKMDQLDAHENLDETIERDISARKAKLYASGAKPAQVSLHCPSCGAEIIPGKKFCADCGSRIIK
jgi:hypothetical protein